MEDQNILSSNHHLGLMTTGFTITTSLQLLYMLRYIYTNPSVFGLVLLSVLILIQCFILFRFPKDQNRKQLIFIWCSSSFFYCSFLIAVSGGFNAPGYYWIYSFPIFVGLLLDDRYSRYSLIPIFIVMLGFYFFVDDLPIPEKFQDPQIMLQKRLSNSIFFCITMAALMTFFYRALRKTQDELNTKSNQLNTLVRVMCHDLKNDIFVAEFHTDKLMSEISFADPKGRLGKIKRASVNIKNMIVKVSDWSLFNTDDMANRDVGSYDAEGIILDSFSTFEVPLNDKEIDLIHSLNTRGAKIKIDPTVFKFQILNNLISNSVKFTPKGGKIHVEASVDKSKLCLRITDSGIGIPEEVRENIFTFRKRGSRDGTEGEKGTGFGLPLVKEFITVYGGSIEIHSPAKNNPTNSEDYPGTEFEIIFPISNG